MQADKSSAVLEVGGAIIKTRCSALKEGDIWAPRGGKDEALRQVPMAPQLWSCQDSALVRRGGSFHTQDTKGHHSQCQRL